MHHQSRHWHLLDFVLVRRRNHGDLLVTMAIPGADGWTDHRLVISEMRTRLQPRRRPQGKQHSGKLNIALLSLLVNHFHFSSKLAQRQVNLPVAAADAAAGENAYMENRWCQLRDTVQSTVLVAHTANIRTGLMTPMPPSATCTLRRTACTKPIPARNAGRLDCLRGREDPGVREPQRMEKVLRRDQNCLWSAS
ncbi:hypothetical protein SprV_0401442900 [Sparganum proliferum]